MNGEVVGINTAVAQAQGIGFAIPSNTVNGILQDLISKGKVIRPWLGVQVSSLSKESAVYLNFDDTQGALVVGVISGSPAASAGLEQGDIIIKCNGNKVSTPDELVELIRQVKIGEQITIAFYRKGQSRSVSINVTEKPSQ